MLYFSIEAVPMSFQPFDAQVFIGTFPDDGFEFAQKFRTAHAHFLGHFMTDNFSLLEMLHDVLIELAREVFVGFRIGQRLRFCKWRFGSAYRSGSIERGYAGTQVFQ